MCCLAATYIRREGPDLMACTQVAADWSPSDVILFNCFLPLSHSASIDEPFKIFQPIPSLLLNVDQYRDDFKSSA